MHGTSASGAGVFWFTATCGEYYICKVVVRVCRGDVIQLRIGLELYMFRTGFLPIIRSLLLYTQ